MPNTNIRACCCHVWSSATLRHCSYGKNKIAHTAWLRATLGFEFLVHGAAFIVHRVHAESEAKRAWRAQMQSRGGPLNSKRLAALAGAMQEGRYKPSLSDASAACIAKAQQRHAAWQQQQQEQQQQGVKQQHQPVQQRQERLHKRERAPVASDSDSESDAGVIASLC
jgi:hypothetical protein